MSEQRRELKARWRSGELLYGIFVRLTNEDVFETLGLTSLDLVMLDAEHGSFDRERLNRCVLSARAANIPVLIRVPGADRTAVQFCIAIGADGVVVPHQNSAAEVAALARFVRTKAVERAYAGAGRASLQRTVSWDCFKAEIARRFLFVVQLDEPECLTAASDIAAIEDLDGIFLGAIGFALARSQDVASSTAEAELEQVCQAARLSGRSLGISMLESRAARNWQRQGVSMFVVDSDMDVLRKGIERRLEEFRSAPS